MVVKLLRTTTGGYPVDTTPSAGDLQGGMMGSGHSPSSNAPDWQRLDGLPRFRILRIILAWHCECLRLILYAMQWIFYEVSALLKLLIILFRPYQGIEWRWKYPALQIPLIAIGGSSLRCTPMRSDGTSACGPLP